MAWTQTITTAGLNLLADAFGRTLNISRVAAASGDVPNEQLTDQTDLTDWIKDLSILSISTSGNNSIIKARLTNIEITNPTLLSQMGVFAQLGEDEEVLLAIFQNDTPSTIPTPNQQQGYEFEPEFQIVHSNVANVTATIDWNAYASLADAQALVDDEKKRAQYVEAILTAGKEDKVAGKGLSSNDYTTSEKEKLASIDAGATSVAIVQTTGNSETSVMSQKAVTEAFANFSSGFLRPKSLFVDQTQTPYAITLIDYDANEWNPDFVLTYGTALPVPSDTAKINIAILPATDPATDATDDIAVWYTAAGSSTWVQTTDAAMEDGFLFSEYGTTDGFYWFGSKFNQLDFTMDASQFAPISHVADGIASAYGVHGLRYHNGKFQIWDGNGWDDVQTGKAIGVGNCTEIGILGDENEIIIAWKDPSDVVCQGATISRWVKTILVRNATRIPESETDGTVVVINTVRDQYADGYADAELTEGTIYFYKLFPVSDTGAVTINDANAISGEAGYDPFKDTAENIEFDDYNGKNSFYVKIPKFRICDVIPGSSNTNWHPAFIVNGVVKNHIYIGKYEARKVSEVAVSQPAVLPTVQINFDMAKSACDLKGDGFHLITNAEWAAVALWCKRKGFMPSGNSDGGEIMETGSSNQSWYHNNDFSGIEGLNGNAHEWCGGLRLNNVNNGEINIIPNNDAAVTGADMSASSSLWKAIMPDGTLVAPGTDGTVKYTEISSKFGSVTTTPAATGAGAELLECLGLIPHAGSTNADYGDDGLLLSKSDPYSFSARGGNYIQGNTSGVFKLDIAPPSLQGNFGFRVAFVN
jgi:hypothetical protein